VLPPSLRGQRVKSVIPSQPASTVLSQKRVFLNDKEEPIMKHKLTTTLLLALCVPIASATTWYVNGVSGSNSNNCLSLTTACKTIKHAISLAASGDSIIVGSGTYTEHLTIGKSLKIAGSGANTTIIDGGASGTVVTISNGTHVTLSRLTIRNGQATSGGGINNAGTLTLINSTVSGNLAPIPCLHFLVFCELRGGRASGGGIYNSGVLTISNSIISGNRAGGYCTITCSAFGGGIYNGGTQMMIKNSTLSGNSASTACSTSISCGVGVGGAFYTFGGTVTLNNSTVSGNSAYRCSGASCGGRGGAIVNGSGNLTMNNSTVNENSAGGIFNGGTATLQNSIIAKNSGKNCGGTITSHGYNLSSDSSCAFSNSGDRDNTNPVLGTLGNYGGPTPTIPLLTGSPAIDAGNPSGCTDGHGNLLKTDQRGAPRPNPEDTGGCDMGAFERQSD
jgi:hypothetical protein